VEERVVTARRTAERRAQDVVDGNFGRLTGDVAGSEWSEVMAACGPPRPTTKWEIVSEETDGDVVHFGVRYSSDADALGLETRWEQFDGGVWKVVKAERVDA
jgi:hypothetical protein